MEVKSVYLDNAATTKLDEEVAREIMNVMENNFGNPSSIHAFGRSSKALIETARRNVAKHINAHSSEIFFTSGGTEADNMVFSTAFETMGIKRFISSAVEHHAVGHSIEHYVSLGAQFDEVRLLDNGHVDLEHLEVLLSDEQPTLVSLMHGNNEIGNLLPLEKVVALCRKYGAYFHSDTVQTMCHYKFDVKAIDLDFMTCSAHKFHGPKGVGFLYARKGLPVTSLIHGGGQERGKRAGTENLYGIIGLSKAMDVAYRDLDEHRSHVEGLKSYMVDQLREKVPGVEFNGDCINTALYTVLSVCFPSTEFNDLFLYQLDLNGIAASGGSACSAGANKGSHVLEAIKADPDLPHVRFSFSKYNSKEDIDYAVEKVAAFYAS